jgi:hypothetical protein
MFCSSKRNLEIRNPPRRRLPICSRSGLFVFHFNIVVAFLSEFVGRRLLGGFLISRARKLMTSKMSASRALASRYVQEKFSYCITLTIAADPGSWLRVQYAAIVRVMQYENFSCTYLEAKALDAYVPLTSVSKGLEDRLEKLLNDEGEDDDAEDSSDVHLRRSTTSRVCLRGPSKRM